MQRADHRSPNSTATATATATTAPTVAPAVTVSTARRRHGTRLRSRPQPRGQELAALEWQQLGACHQADQSVFFGPDTRGEPREDRRRRLVAAKRVCALCPVREICRNYALENREEYGVWGGLSEAERRELIIARRRAQGGDDGRRAPVEAQATVSPAGRV
jgi:WhiB family redox-sensing transcriptional regulator